MLPSQSYKRRCVAWQHFPYDQILPLQTGAGEDDIIHLPNGLGRVDCKRQEEEETSTVEDMSGAVLFRVGSSAFLMPSYIPLMFPVMAADRMFSLSSAQYLFAKCQAVWLALLLAILRICAFHSLGVCLYSAKAARLASITGVITVDLALNQSCDFEDFFPKVATAVR